MHLTRINKKKYLLLSLLHGLASSLCFQNYKVPFLALVISILHQYFFMMFIQEFSSFHKNNQKIFWGIVLKNLCLIVPAVFLYKYWPDSALQFGLFLLFQLIILLFSIKKLP